MTSFDEARQRERGYHVAFYAKHNIGDAGTWLANPAPYVLGSFQYITPGKGLRALDLGAGIGRHAIPLAKHLGDDSTVTCVDILPSALQKLQENARAAGVQDNILCVQADIQDYDPDNTFDYVLSVSAIEHLASREKFVECIKSLQGTTNPDGVNCFMIATDHQWTDKTTGQDVPPIVEQNLSSTEVEELLKDLYRDWDVKDLSSKCWKVTESVDGRDVICASTCVQFTAKKSKEA